MSKLIASENIIKTTTKLSQPYCPHCYDGCIMEDINRERKYFCCSCYKEVIIKKFEG